MGVSRPQTLHVIERRPRRCEVSADAYERLQGVFGLRMRVVHYDLAVPAEAREATERALAVHPLGCPAHQSVQAAIEITWDAALRVGNEVVSVRSEDGHATSA